MSFNFTAAQKNSLAQGRLIRCFGETRPGKYGLEMAHPEYKLLGEEQAGQTEEALTPVYPTTEGLRQLSLRSQDAALYWAPALEQQIQLARQIRPGLNGKPWATAVNGHSVAVGPVAVLRDGAKVAQAPKLQFITDYASAQKKQSPGYASVANTYEGESQILYRVFALDQQKSPVSCIDIVFDKRAGNAVAGEIFYPKQGDAYVAQFTPKRR